MIKKMIVEVPNYKLEEGFKFNWSHGFELCLQVDSNVITLSANKAGLLSLANHLLNLAQDEVPSGYHIHLDEYNSLESGSSDLIIQKM
jgi:hypothetical protein